jgi:hypothetical protein
MTDSSPRRLEPDEVLRVMDAAQVIRARREALDRDAFDRDAAVREIQIMYEEVGDLVGRDVIERALDDYMSERYAFTPHPKTAATALAWAYVRRGMLGRRVVAPVVIVGALAWAGMIMNARAESRALARDLASLQSNIELIRTGHDTERQALDQMRDSPVADALTPAAANGFRTSADAAETGLAAVAAMLSVELRPSRVPDQPTRQALDDLLSQVRAAQALLADARRDIAAARSPLQDRETLIALSAEVPLLLAGIRGVATEPGVAGAQAQIAAAAERQAAAADLRGLESSVTALRRALATLELEYTVEIVGGVWRQSNDDPLVRNYYLRVRALDDEGSAILTTVRNEEDGRTEVVREWAERVPKEVYDRVAADKQDNGIIDELDFGAKRRGWMTMDRRFPDVGQITRW